MTRQLVRGAARWVEIALIPVLWLIPADAMAQRHSRGGGGGGRHFSQPAPRQQSTAISPHSYSESPSNPRRPWPPDPRRPWPRPGPVPRPSPVPGPAPVTRRPPGGGGWGGNVMQPQYPVWPGVGGPGPGATSSYNSQYGVQPQYPVGPPLVPQSMGGSTVQPQDPVGSPLVPEPTLTPDQQTGPVASPVNSVPTIPTHRRPVDRPRWCRTCFPR